MMTKTYYHGDRAHFKWEDYVATHMEAHELFKEANESLTEAMKILDLKNGIRDSAMMENTLEAAHTNAPTNRTFPDYVNFLMEAITSKQIQI